MIDAKQKKEAKQNFDKYLQDGLLKKEKNETARQMYIKNAEQSLNLAEECMISPLRPHLWVVVISYYSMFYIANAVLLQLGYKTGSKIVHKVTSDALIVLVMDKIRKGLLEEYEDAKDGSIYWVRSVINPSFGEAGEIVGYVTVSTIITDIMAHIEEAVKKLKK